VNKRKKNKKSKKQTRPRASTRKRLEQATAAYYASLSGEALEEERRLEIALTSTLGQINFDEDY
jgi:hypothetical protein